MLALLALRLGREVRGDLARQDTGTDRGAGYCGCLWHRRVLRGCSATNIGRRRRSCPGSGNGQCASLRRPAHASTGCTRRRGRHRKCRTVRGGRSMAPNHYDSLCGGDTAGLDRALRADQRADHGQLTQAAHSFARTSALYGSLEARRWRWRWRWPSVPRAENLKQQLGAAPVELWFSWPFP